MLLAPLIQLLVLFLRASRFFDYTTEETAQRYEIKDLLPLYSAYTSSSELVIVGTDRFVLLNTDTGKTIMQEYEGSLRQFACGQNGTTAIVTDDQLGGTSSLILFDKNGKQVSAVSVADTPIDLCVADDRVLFLGKKAVYHYDLSLKLQEEITLQSSAQKVTFTDGSMFLLGADTVYKYSIR